MEKSWDRMGVRTSKIEIDGVRRVQRAEEN